MENKTLTIHKTNIPAGEKAIIRLQVGRLPSDTLIHLNVHVFRGKEEGPTMLVMGGVHGDEINGVEIIRRAIAQKMFEGIQAGTVIAIPVLNIYGFNNFSREVPDGKDVNRSFPGSTAGSLASRVARIITKKILPLIDFGIDLHTGGNSNYNYPQVRYSIGHEASRMLGEAFAPPYLIAKRPIPKSFRKIALDNKVPVLTFEAGENLRFDGYAIEKGLAGIKRVMQVKNMLPGTPVDEKVIHIPKTSWMRATRSGLFRWMKCSGHKVKKGEPLGVINDPYGQTEVPILSTRDGYIIGHNNAPVVNPGDALFHIGIL